MPQKNIIIALAIGVVISFCFLLGLMFVSPHKKSADKNGLAQNHVSVFSRGPLAKFKTQKTRLSQESGAIGYRPDVGDNSFKYSYEAIKNNMPSRYYSPQGLYERAKLEKALGDIITARKKAKKPKRQPGR